MRGVCPSSFTVTLERSEGSQGGGDYQVPPHPEILRLPDIIGTPPE